MTSSPEARPLDPGESKVGREIYRTALLGVAGSEHPIFSIRGAIDAGQVIIHRKDAGAHVVPWSIER